MYRLFFSLMIIIAVNTAKAQQHSQGLPVTNHKEVVIAHRGDHTFFPDNTLEGYQSAIKLGVDYIETDLRTTKDGGLVIMHNSSVNRMTGAAGEIADLSYDYVRSLKIVDSAHHKTYHIPDFKEVLALCKGKVNIYLDFKDANVDTAYKMIKAAGMEKHVVVYANTLDQFKTWRKVAPKMPVMTSVPDEVKDVASLKAFLDEYPVSCVDGSIGQYSADMLTLFKTRGVAVWLDVQDNDEGPATWSKALDEQVPGMQTDHPAALIKYLTQQSKR